MAQVNHIFRRRAVFNRGRRDVGTAWAGYCSYTAWLDHPGDRVSMGEKVARNSSSMAARPFSKSQVEKVELSRPSMPWKSDTRFCFKYFRASA